MAIDAVGAITFSGSVIAFLKLQGIMSAPITFKGHDLLNALILVSIVILTFIYVLLNQVIYFGY